MTKTTQSKAKNATLRYLSEDEIRQISSDAAEVVESMHASQSSKVHARMVLRQMSVRRPMVAE